MFATDRAGVVCKLYRAAGTDKWRRLASKVQQSEAQAYKSAHEDDVLCKHVAGFYGLVRVTSVVEYAVDRSANYLLETGLLLELLEGPEEKATQLPPKQFPHIYRLAARFKTKGIDVGDASAFNYQDPMRTKFIDIITRYGADILAEV